MMRSALHAPTSLLLCGSRPLRVEAITPDGLTAYGAQADERREVALDLLADVQVGDTVLVHGGIALQRAEEQSSAQEVDHD